MQQIICKTGCIQSVGGAIDSTAAQYTITAHVKLYNACLLYTSTVPTCAHLDYSIWMGSIFFPPSLNLWELLAVFASALWERIQPSGTGSLRDWKAHLLSLLTLTDSHRRSSKNLNNAPAVPCCAINRIPVPKSSRTSARNTCVPAHSLYIHQQTPYFKSLRMRRSSQ